MDRHYVYKECQKTSARLLMVLDWCSTIARRDGNSGIMTTIHQVDRSLKRDHYDKLTHRSADMELCPAPKICPSVKERESVPLAHTATQKTQ